MFALANQGRALRTAGRSASKNAGKPFMIAQRSQNAVARHVRVESASADASVVTTPAQTKQYKVALLFE